MPRAAREVIAAAVARGAITEARARYWATRPDSEVRWLDAAAGGAVAAGPAAAPARVPPGSDPLLFAGNPLLEELTRSHPALVNAAMADDPHPPKLFGREDLPRFTASGLPPEQLAALPWPLRRPVAAAPTLAAAYALAAKYEGAPEMAHADLARSAANAEYLSEFSRWLAGHGPPADRPDPANDYSVEALHAELFGGRTFPGSGEPT